MAFIGNSDITVFPSTKRAAQQLSARLLSEERISGIIRQIIDNDSFIITPLQNFDMNKPFEFNVHGYYFKTSTASAICNLFSSATSGSIYAKIKIESVGSSVVYSELANYANPGSGNYPGVVFTQDSTLDSGEYNIELFTYATSGWVVAESSRLKFSSDSLSFNIDGGEI